MGSEVKKIFRIKRPGRIFGQKKQKPKTYFRKTPVRNGKSARLYRSPMGP